MADITDNFVMLTDESWDGSSLIITQLTGNIYNFDGNDTSGTSTNIAESTTGVFHDTNNDGGLDDNSSNNPAEDYTAAAGSTLSGTTGTLMFTLEVQALITHTDGSSETIALDVMVLDNNQILFDFGDFYLDSSLNLNAPIATIEIIGTTQATYDWINISAHDDAYVPLCFTAGTMLRTGAGSQPIQALKVGDKVWTADNGLQTIRWIHKQEFSEHALLKDPKLRPVLISKGALGPQTPAEELRLSRQHRVFVSSPIVRRMFDVDEILVSALNLTQLPGIFIDEAITNVTYFHLLFDRHEILEANGMLAESFFTGPEAIKSLSTDAKSELHRIFPEIFAAKRVARKARPTPDQRKIRKLVHRHTQNKKVLNSSASMMARR